MALELGGKSPTVVCADADLDAAAAMVAWAGTGLLSGQGCALPTRTYVHEDVYDGFVARVLSQVEGLAVGDPLEPSTIVGPVVSGGALARILGVVHRARADGATLLTGGARLGGDLADGWFVAPTVFGDVDQASDLARHEVFGPVQALLRFSTDDEALARANDSPYGLAAYVFTTDSDRLEWFVRNLEAACRDGQRRRAHRTGHPVRWRQAERLRARGRPGRLRRDGPGQGGPLRSLSVRPPGCRASPTTLRGSRAIPDQIHLTLADALFNLHLQ